VEKPLALFMMATLGNTREVVGEQCGIQVWKEIGDREAFLAAEGADVRVIVTGGGFPLKPEFLDRLPNLGLIACLGSGYEALDRNDIRARGVKLSYGPGSNNADVADVAVGLTIAVVRRFPLGESVLRSGRWKGPVPLPMAKSLYDLRYGIVGLGAIGKAIATRLEAFGGDISWWGPRPKPEARWPRAETLLDLARESDVLILALRADAETRGLIDSAVLEAVGPEGYLINIARGHAVDEERLVELLRNGGIAGAGLDVFSPEPTNAARWEGLNNVVLTPHLGGWAQGAFGKAEQMLAENIRRYLAGEVLLTPIP
jgi:phosphoglycerate dehydrogenase-like enzyme